MFPCQGMQRVLHHAGNLPITLSGQLCVVSSLRFIARPIQGLPNCTVTFAGTPPGCEVLVSLKRLGSQLALPGGNTNAPVVGKVWRLRNGIVPRTVQGVGHLIGRRVCGRLVRSLLSRFSRITDRPYT
jgi:hypothetical protein